MLKKHLLTAAKALGFFAIWVLITIFASDAPAFIKENAALLRLWWEFVPMFGVLLITGAFIWIVEKRKIRVPIFRKPLKNIISGAVLGCIWLGGTILFLFFIGSISFGDKSNISYLAIWFLSALLNVIMQEYLVRGYLFSLFRETYNTAAALIITTILFTVMHGGAFEAGIIAVLNVITMSIFVSLLMIYTESLLAPIVAHFIWNSVGRIVFGVVSLADDYPSMWNPVLSGNVLITGGSAKIEGSIIVLIINLLLIAFVTYQLKRQKKGKLL